MRLEWYSPLVAYRERVHSERERYRDLSSAFHYPGANQRQLPAPRLTSYCRAAARWLHLRSVELQLPVECPAPRLAPAVIGRAVAVEAKQARATAVATRRMVQAHSMRRACAIARNGETGPQKSEVYDSFAAIFSAARVASVMIVICGLTPSEVGTAAPSTT